MALGPHSTLRLWKKQDYFLTFLERVLVSWPHLHLKVLASGLIDSLVIGEIKFIGKDNTICYFQ